MAPDDEDEEDLYDDEFDFVDDDEDDLDESDVETSDTEESDGDDVDDSELDRGEPAPDSELDNEPAPRPTVAKRSAREAVDDDVAVETERDGSAAREEEPVDEYGRPEPSANYRVHIYEFRQFKRTIDRPFTPEDAEAFASEYNRTSKSYGRFAVAGKEDAKPRKTLD